MIAKDITEEKMKELRGDVVIPEVEGTSSEVDFNDMINNLPGAPATPKA